VKANMDLGFRGLVECRVHGVRFRVKGNLTSTRLPGVGMATTSEALRRLSRSARGVFLEQRNPCAEGICSSMQLQDPFPRVPGKSQRPGSIPN
jgi:hypothetical protein